MRAVILAGGQGSRLAPYTAVLPKPLMPLGDMPILELLVRRLAQSGVTHITLAVNHLASLIQAFFGDGERLGVRIDYSLESHPLGTAGPLSLISGLDEPFLVMNGDLLTDLDFRALTACHQKANAAATIGLYERENRVDFGVIEVDAADRIQAYHEKPSEKILVSMGVYAMSPEILGFLPNNSYFDLPDLIRALTAAGKTVQGYRHGGYWLDIGRPDDYARAQEDFPEMRACLLGDA